MLRVFLFPNEIRAETDEANVFDFIPRLATTAYSIAGHDVLRPAASGNWSSVGWYNETTNQAVAAGLVAGVGSLAGVRVRIPNGTSLSYNLVDSSPADVFGLEVGGTLNFDNSANRTLKVGTIYVLPDSEDTPSVNEIGQLTINFPDSSKKASIIFTDAGWVAGNAIAGMDPKHFSGGLVAYGKVNIQGAAHTTTTSGAAGDWAYATGSLSAGASTILLDRALPDWKVGDRIFVPDTRMVDLANQYSSIINVQDEELIVTGVSTPASNTTLTVQRLSGSGGLQYAHPAIRRQDAAQTIVGTAPARLMRSLDRPRNRPVPIGSAGDAAWNPARPGANGLGPWPLPPCAHQLSTGGRNSAISSS